VVGIEGVAVDAEADRWVLRVGTSRLMPDRELLLGLEMGGWKGRAEVRTW
jgi:hypothetical protein